MLHLCVREWYYQFTCLLFGLSCAPWVFALTLKPVTTILSELRIRFMIYKYDIPIIVKKREQARDHIFSLIYPLENLGFIIHPVKSLTKPTQEIEFHIKCK